LENSVSDESLNVLTDLIAKAKTAGADAADAIIADGESTSVTYRLGELEQLEHSEGGDIGLRVLVGKKQAIVSSSDRSPEALSELVDRAVAMAKTVPDDELLGLADPDQLATDLIDLDMCDPDDISTETLIEAARTCEEAARAIKGVTNSEGAQANWGRTRVAIAASNGFQRAYESTGGSFSASVLAGDVGTGMETDYEYTSAVYAEDFKTPEEVGRAAGERAVRKLGARKIKSGKFPIVFESRAASGMVSHFLGAINGAAVARGTTFLKDHMEKAVFSDGIIVSEDPHRARGLRSKPCDAEGLANMRRNLIDNGVLTTWVLDLRSARKLGLTPTGHASRGPSSPPSPSVTNVVLEAGSQTPEELIAEIQTGLFVTDAFGQGVNGVTGDYSRGVGGFWIENGEISYPVNEITIASNLKEMFMSVTPANDLDLSRGIDSPTIRIDGMSVAGS
jgi:PmbA protein